MSDPSDRFAETLTCGCEWHAGTLFPCAHHRLLARTEHRHTVRGAGAEAPPCQACELLAEKEQQLSALSGLVYQMQMETWLQTPEQKAQWFYDHGVRLAPGRLEYCDRCDGVGWYEGGKTLKTTCERCHGTGIANVPVSRPDAPRWVCVECGARLTGGPMHSCLGGVVREGRRV